MPFISITRLRIRKWRYLPAFFYFTFLSLRQARRTPGNLSTAVVRDACLAFWTITVWSDEQAMLAFRNHGAHLRAMPKLLEWCDEATYAHGQQASAEPPELIEAYERLLGPEGIVWHVKHPSPQQATRDFPRPRE